MLDMSSGNIIIHCFEENLESWLPVFAFKFFHIGFNLTIVNNTQLRSKKLTIMIIYDFEESKRTISEGVLTGSPPSESVFLILFCFITIGILVACLFSIICIYSLSNCVAHQDEDDFDQNPIILPINEERSTNFPAKDPTSFIW